MNWLKDKWIDLVVWYEYRQAQPMTTAGAWTFFVVVHILIILPFLFLVWQKYTK